MVFTAGRHGPGTLRHGSASMVHRLEIENFYSIRDRQVIDLGFDDPPRDDASRLAPLWTGADRYGPKVVALFGANAAGKSNVLKALSFLIWFLKDSFLAPLDRRLPFDRFNRADMLREPTRLVLGLTGPRDLTQIGDPRAPLCRYEYELDIGGGTQPVVAREALSWWPNGGGKRAKLFERDEAGRVSASDAFGLGALRSVLPNVLRPRASVIATLAQFKHPFAGVIWSAAANTSYNLLIWKAEDSEDDVVRLYNANPDLLARLNREIQRIDLGIDAMELRPSDKGVLAYFKHRGMPEPMPLLYQSEGTRQFVRQFPRIFHALKIGGLLIADELDTAIHPLLMPEILRWFRDPEVNQWGAQLWMSCHNVTLLDDLSREEVLFCEKDGEGATEIYGLSDIDGVQPNDDFYRKYIGGVFGAVPTVG